MQEGIDKGIEMAGCRPYLKMDSKSLVVYSYMLCQVYLMDHMRTGRTYYCSTTRGTTTIKPHISHELRCLCHQVNSVISHMCAHSVVADADPRLVYSFSLGGCAARGRTRACNMLSCQLWLSNTVRTHRYVMVWCAAQQLAAATTVQAAGNMLAAAA